MHALRWYKPVKAERLYEHVLYAEEKIVLAIKKLRGNSTSL